MHVRKYNWEKIISHALFCVKMGLTTCISINSLNKDCFLRYTGTVACVFRNLASICLFLFCALFLSPICVQGLSESN